MEKLNRVYVWSGSPRWPSGKESIYKCGKGGFNLWVGKILWRRKWQPTPVFLSRESNGQRSLEGHSPWGWKESDMTSWLGTHTCMLINLCAGFYQQLLPFKLEKAALPVEMLCYGQTGPEWTQRKASWHHPADSVNTSRRAVPPRSPKARGHKGGSTSSSQWGYLSGHPVHGGQESAPGWLSVRERPLQIYLEHHSALAHL